MPDLTVAFMSVTACSKRTRRCILSNVFFSLLDVL